jgi:glycosyltransferase involved in cell wall biosynthesis
MDITGVINLHAEGTLARPSLESAMRARRLAEERGLSVQLIAVLDCADAATATCVRTSAAGGIEIVEVAVDDLGEARNAGVEAAAGQWIAFLDGDDLWCENWLADAHTFALGQARTAILHPLANLYFGLRTSLLIHADMDDQDFVLADLALANQWTALSFARRDVYRAVPFARTAILQQIAFEDWSWNMMTISRGYVHKCVPGTVHALRTRTGSLSERAATGMAMPAPTGLFRQHLAATPVMTMIRHPE